MPGSLSNDAILASARCGLAVLSPQGEWRAVNPALCRLLGHADDTLVGTAAHRQLFPAQAARIDAELQAARDGAAPRPGLDLDYRHPHGATLRLVIHADPVSSVAAAPALLLQVHDITAAHRAQAALDLAGRQQEDLAFGLSHDLRGALRGIDGFAARLDRQPLDAEGRDHLARIRAAAAQAGSLVDALVALSRAGTAAYADAEVDISLLATWVAAELQDAAPQRAMAVAVQPGLLARGDERQLKRMLEQLLHNAWKFSAPGPDARIEVSGRITDAGRLELTVGDHGVGFDMRYADKLFVPFRRLHGTEEGGGHGLGLAIVQAVVQRHGGRVWADSQPGAGSRFFVELPAAHAGSER